MAGNITRIPYRGGGLGPVGDWKCPSCGTTHGTRIELGCDTCGAGTPQQRTEAVEANVTITDEELEIVLGIAGSGEEYPRVGLQSYHPKVRLTVARALAHYADHGAPSGEELTKKQIVAWARAIIAADLE